jgi:hypothetical protein
MARVQVKPKGKRLSNAQAVAKGLRLGLSGKLAMDASTATLLKLLDGMEDKGESGPPLVEAPGTLGPPGVGEPDANPDMGLGDPEGTNKAALAEDDDLENKVRELLTGKLDDADLEMLLKLIRP